MKNMHWIFYHMDKDFKRGILAAICSYISIIIIIALLLFLYYSQMVNNFIANLLSTILGVLIAAYISWVVFKKQQRDQIKYNYVVSLRSIFSEIQDNEYVLREGEKMDLTVNPSKKYKILLVILNHSILSGVLPSLSTYGNHKLIASLCRVERTTIMHNLAVESVLQMMSCKNFQADIFDWFYDNLNKKQKVLLDAFEDIMKVLVIEIKNNSSIEALNSYFSENKATERDLKKISVINKV
jgi:hypothetical protein